ncbi:MAG: DNA repair protein RecN [Planctomycetota bacterium]
MLVELRIKNLLLIPSAEIDFTAGLNVLTGETGAGKSLLVDALLFLLGARGDADLVRQGEAQAEVSARFLLSDPELIDFFSNELGIVFEAPSSPAELVLSRTLPRSGRPRAHANGRPVSLPALKDLADRLLDIHGQHENQSLLRPATRLDILDRFAEATSERNATQQAHLEASRAAQSLAELRHAARDRQGREDMLRFQLKELDDARLDELDSEHLEGEVRLLRDAEKVRAAALDAGSALDGDDNNCAAALLARAVKNFNALGDAGPDVSALTQRLHTTLAELREITRDMNDLAEKARSDPDRLASLEDRRALLKALERKHGRDLNALRVLRQKLRADLQDIEQLEVRTEEREIQLVEAVKKLRSACDKLSCKRKAAARKLEKCVNKELADLDLKNAKLQIVLTANAPAEPMVTHQSAAPDTLEQEARALLPIQLKPAGAETLEILFSANPELPARPLKDCASGGEISRVMLALKGVLARMSGADRLPVVVFDEIDAGVGGRLGAILGKKLRDLAKVRQVLSITHQPQIAAYAQRQLKVEKRQSGGVTVISVKSLERPQRVEELALMLRGEAASTRTRQEAEAMLHDAQAD